VIFYELGGIAQHFTCNTGTGAAGEQFGVHANMPSGKGGVVTVGESREAQARSGAERIG